MRVAWARGGEARVAVQGSNGTMLHRTAWTRGCLSVAEIGMRAPNLYGGTIKVSDRDT
jgi:hypothetical protein